MCRSRSSTHASPLPHTMAKPPRDHWTEYTRWLATNSSANIVDPVALCEDSKGRAFSKRAAMDLNQASGEYFNRKVKSIIQHLEDTRSYCNADNKSKSKSSKDAAASMYHRLWEAVRHGSPANFTNQDELLVYTVDRLPGRCRYLYALLMAGGPELEICSRARRLFLPTTLEDRQQSPVKVCSVGGGPGIDHIALSVLRSFLAEVQPRQENEETAVIPVVSITAREVETIVFDLYAEDWLPIIRVVTAEEAESQGQRRGEGKTEEAEEVEEKEVEEKEKEVVVVEEEEKEKEREEHNQEQKKVTAEYCNICEPLTAPCNAALARSASEADLFVFQFVLHENASHLVVKEKEVEENRVGGCMVGILQDAKAGAIIICTDASHHLWPALLATGCDYGWSVASGPKTRVSLGSNFTGPKWCCFLEKQ